MQRCKYQDCGSSERYRGYCQKHYYDLLYSGQLPRKRQKNSKSAAERLAGRYIVDPVTGCWIWQGAMNRGYPVISVNNKLLKRASHVSYEAVFGPIPKGMQALHRCDTPRCINAAHLFLGSSLDNMQDCKTKGRLGQQTGNYCRKITDKMADAMRICFARGEYTIEGLAEIYNTSHQNVAVILRGQGHQKNSFSR